MPIHLVNVLRFSKHSFLNRLQYQWDFIMSENL